VLSTLSNADLVTDLIATYTGTQSLPGVTTDAYVTEATARVTGSHTLCVNDSDLWGAPDHPNAAWYVVAPRLNQFFAAKGVTYPDHADWSLPPIPPHACS
jgi:hypothetical protein